MISIVFTSILLTGLATAAPAQDRQDDPALEALVASALDAHPDLSAINAQIEALDHRVAQSWTVPDPVVAAEYSNMPLTSPWPGNHPMSGVQFKLSQKVLLPSKLYARADAARANRDALKPSLDETRNRLVSKVRLLAEQWRLTRGLHDVTVRHIAATNDLIRAVRAKYEVGRAEQYDLLRLEVLRDKLQDDLVELDRRADAIAGTLNAAAQRPASEAIKLRPANLIPPRTDATTETLFQEAENSRPLLATLSAKAKARRVAAQTLRTEKWPDVTTWVGYRFRAAVGTDPGSDFLTAGISMPIPWSSATYGYEERALAMQAKAKGIEAQRDSVLLKLRGDLDSNRIRYQRAKERAGVYTDKLIPGAKKTLEAALGSYQVDRAGFAELYAAEISALNFERVAVRSRAEAATASITLNTLIGRYAQQMQSQGDAE